MAVTMNVRLSRASWRAHQSGQGMAEYSVITAVIILTAFLVFQSLGAQLSPLVGIVLAALGA